MLSAAVDNERAFSSKSHELSKIQLNWLKDPSIYTIMRKRDFCLHSIKPPFYFILKFFVN